MARGLDGFFCDTRCGCCAVLKDRRRGGGLSPFSGGFGEGETPLPIPNRAVKPLSADGTWLARARESRTPPVFSQSEDGRRPGGRPSRASARAFERETSSCRAGASSTGERHTCAMAGASPGRRLRGGLVNPRACSRARCASALPVSLAWSTSQSTLTSSSSSRKERNASAAASARCVSVDGPLENMCSHRKFARGQKHPERTCESPRTA